MDRDVSGIRISPASVEFYDTVPNTVEQLNVTVKNISKGSKSIRFYAPKSKKFKLKVKNPEKPVAPGLCIPAIVEYSNTEDGEFKDRIVVTVDGEVVEIPIVAHPTKPILEIDQMVDFGNIVANSKTIAREISLVNHGSKAGEFKIKYAGDQPIAIMPTSGSVPPKSVQLIKIEFVTKYPGRIEEIAKIKLEGQDTKLLTMKANLVDQGLQILSLQTEAHISCIGFGNTYYGSDKTECALLYNNGPEPINFVAILDEDAIAQEMGIDLTKSTIMALADKGEGSEVQGETNVLTSLVTAIPNQGILQPYEKIPVFFRFSPRWNGSAKGFKGKIAPPPRKDFALFIKLQIIGSSAAEETAGDTFVEVALTGTALPVLLDMAPACKFDFGEVPVGEHADILCTVKNNSDTLPITYQFRRIAHFIAHPPNGKIPPLGTQDVIFSFAPNQAGFFKPQQMVDVIGHVADSRNPTMAHLQIIHTMPVYFIGRSDPITKHRNAKFNPGLTPYISNEVGMFVDTTFTSLGDEPRNAVVGGKKTKIHRLETSLTENDANTKVAFPNDLAHSIRPSDRHEQYNYHNFVWPDMVRATEVRCPACLVTLLNKYRTTNPNIEPMPSHGTIFTRSKRHTYVDPDYAYIDDEDVQKWKHRDSYVHLLRDMQDRRINRKKAREFKATNTTTDIGIKPAAGIRPKKLTLEEIKPDPKPPSPPNADFKLLSSKSLNSSMSLVAMQPVKDGLNAVPTTPKEKIDCSKFLTPQDQHQVVIGPSLLDFGQVCLRSITTKKLEIVNNLDQNVLVVAEIDCRELRQSSPLSQVVPAKSKASIPIIFESNTKQNFQRSVSYTVNNYHKHHVTVLAEVVPVALELSTDELVLKPTYGLPSDAGFRGIITLFNRMNYPAEFTWAPNLGEKGTAFSIRPATGVVDPHKDLDCEVVWHPSFLAPEDGSFSLMIHSGTTLQLKCRAELGPTHVQFVERRIMFGQVPVNLTTTRRVLLANTGQNHAFFQVNDPAPFPGLNVSPIHGVVPVGGNAELQVKLTPDAILKFDTRVSVALKGGKNLELRMSGTVEPPSVDIDLTSFNFGGVYCGSGSTMTFKLTNQMYTKAKLEFDLTRYKDFTLNFPGYQTQEDYTFQVLNPGMHSLTLQAQECIEGELIFMPTEVAAYDFILPVTINYTGAPSPAPTPHPPTPAPSNKNSIQHIINLKPQPYTVITPRKHVISTALRQPLQLSTNKIEMNAPSSFYDPSIQTGQMQSKGTILVNNSDANIKWGIDLRSTNRAVEEGVFKFVHPSGAPFTNPTGEETRGIEGELKPGETQQVSVLFCPKEPGKYEALFPIILDENYSKPYQYLQVSAELKAPKLWFDPLAIVLTPVPLLTDATSEFTMFAAQFKKITKIEVDSPEVECEDGSKISPLKVTFLEGSSEVKPCCGDEGQIEPYSIACKVTFQSPRPVSFADTLKFYFEGCSKPFTLMVTATADNCLMTCYPFLALHRTDHQIVCEQGSVPKGRKTQSKESLNNFGEAVFIPCQTPNAASRPSTSATSSNFQVSSSSYESTASVTDSTGDSPINRDGAKNKPPSGSDHMITRRDDLQSRSLGSAMFPDEDTEEGIFHMEVLLSVQRWFSAQGWPGGPYPISIPLSLRQGISRKPVEEEKPAKAGSWDTNNLKKEFKTIYDMISNLAGRAVPGIPLNGHLPSDSVERVKQVFWQHSTLLTFLRCQGACVASIKPEYLMDMRDYHLWKQLQTEYKMELERKGDYDEAAKIEQEEELDDEVFEAVSKRAWTDILLQILKTLVLAKVTPRTLKNMPSPDKNVCMPDVNPDPLSSNIYCVAERILLGWLNHHYEHYRQKIWQNCEKGGIPPSRWIVNFDFDLLDGLVIGAVLGAHMPFLIKTHLEDMYTHPASAEQCLHNALKIVNAMRYAGIDYDIQAIDITDPNPIALMLLCVHMYQKLPQYLPKATVEFQGSLHSMVSRQVKLSNPSGKPLVYQVLLAGHDGRDFNVPKGDFVSIPPKSTLPLSVEFTSKFLRPAEAILVLIGRRQGSAVGSTLTFNLRTQVDNITPKANKQPEHVIKCESPCYELEKICMQVTNPFNEAGEFRIVLVEASGALLDPNQTTALLKKKERKKKRVKSKIDSGIPRADTPPSPPPRIQDTLALNKDKDETMMSAFFSPVSSVYLDAKTTATVEIHFLPFNVGERQCSVIFLNESVGEFLYSIEAKSRLPLPDAIPFIKTTHSVRISSAAAAGTGKGLFGGDERVVYWKCEAGQLLQENLTIPFNNTSREKALILASQQHMTELEYTRRMTTGTLHSSSVAAQTITKLSNDAAKAIKKAQERHPRGNTYKVEVDSAHYKLPDKLYIPTTGKGRSHSAPAGANTLVVCPDRAGRLEIPVKFHADEPGHYPCEIVLRGNDDVRVFKIECTVNPEGSTAEINFSSPVHQNLTQELPLVNMTNNDWPLKAHIEGTGFHGPASILAKAFQTSKYPLVYRPQNELPVKGKLVLTNTEDGSEHVFQLSGVAEKPLALEHVKLKSAVKKTLTYRVKVPNVTKKKLCYKVESDLSIVSGNQSVTVLPGQQAMYTIVMSPVRRGVFKGVVAFVAGKNPVVEVDSDGDEMPDEDDETRQYYGYRVWYSLEIHVKPAPPERVLDVTCACHKLQLLEVIVRNPTQKEVELEATIEGLGLSGPASISLPSGSKDVYTLQYAPAIIGQSRGSLIFYHELVGEFWYQLQLSAESPPQTTLPHMECELGRWTKQTISLENPTEEILELVPTVSNTNNFSLERDNERPLILPARSKLEVPVHFMPSTLGEGDHLAKIIFVCEQLGEWVYVASGTGLVPQTQDPVSVFTVAGSNTTLIIPFRNPMDYAVLAEVILRDKNLSLEEAMQDGAPSEDESPFCLLLKRKAGIRVGPKSTLDIPVCFAPTEMKMYEALCTVVVSREDGQKWKYAPKDHQGYQLSRTGGEGLSEIRWLFPIQGIPESQPIKESFGAIIECKARDRLEERLEVTLAGVAPVTSGPQKSIYTRSITPKNQSPKLPDGIVVGETLATAEEFSYEFAYKSKDSKEDLQNSVALKLVRQHRDTTSGLVVLVFNVIYNPFRTMDHGVSLEVKAAQGGVWKFPIRFLATEPVVDDIIDIEATGLNRDSFIGFKLTSQTKYPMSYNAYFGADSDPEFSVTPSSGELLPLGSNGSMIRVGFKPSVYGKIYTGRLIVQTPDMQWSYNCRGILPDYDPPRGISSRPMKGPHPDPRMRANKTSYILQNLKLKTTAVSSPVKGAPILQRIKMA